MRLSNLVAVSLTLASLSASAATFPTSWRPVAINDADGGVVNLGDPINDGSNNGRNIVGDNARPAFYTASDSTHFFFRMRIDTDPAGPGGLSSYGWGILIDADGDIRDYDYALMLNGTGESVDYSRKTAKTLAGDPTELADQLLNSVPTSYAGATQNVAISTIGVGAAGFSGNEDYFLDVAVPLSTFYGTNPDGGAYLNFSPSTIIRFWVGVSNSSRQIQVDLGGTGASPGPGTLAGTVSVPQLLCSTDSTCGGATSGRICSSGTCVDGCRGTGGNTCSVGNVCSSATSAEGTCSPSTVPTVVSPANGSRTSSTTPTISGTSPANATITLFVDGVSIGTTTANASGAWSRASTALTQGSHTVSATATVGGVTSAASATNTFTVDSIAPAAPVVSTPASGSSTSNNRPVFTGTAEANSTVSVMVDGFLIGTATTNGAGAWSFTAVVALSDGSHTVVAAATDAAGNVSINSAANTFTVDTTAPAAPVVSTPANGSRVATATPSITGTAEANATVTVFIDGVSVGTTTANGSGSWTFTTSALSEASHTVRATATDSAGNVSVSSNTNTFTVDTVPPAAPVVITPANGSRTSSNTPSISGTAEANSTITVIIDGVAVGTAAANASGAWTFTSPLLSDGAHAARATATDAVGNVSVSSNTNTFTVDTTAPAAPVVVTPGNGSRIGSNTPSITGTAEANATITVFVDGVSVGTTTANASGAWTFTSAQLADGAHTTRATATDSVGNVSVNSNTNSFTVDTTPPAAPIVATPANGSRTGDNTPTVSGTSEANATVTVSIDGVVAGTVTADASGNWSFTTAALAEGAHTVRVTATDSVGNVSVNSNTNTFTVDTVPPAAPVVTAPANGSSTANSTPSISGTAEANSTVTVIIDGVSAGTTTANASGTWTFTSALLADGVHTARATATDAVGNVSVNSNTNSFSIDTSAPVAPAIITPANGARIATNTARVTGVSDANVTITVFIDGVSAGTTMADSAGNWAFTTASLADGAHAVLATATDAVGNVSVNSNTNTFTIDTTPPAAAIVTAPANGSRTGDNTPTVSGTAEANATVTVSIDGVVVGTVTADASGNWSFTTAALADGAHTVRVTARDSVGNVSVNSNTNTFTVDTVPPAAPVVTAPANGSRTASSTPSVSGTAEANSTITVFIDGVAAGTTTADAAGVWTFTSTTLADGAHTVRVIATDAVGNASVDSNTNTFTVDTTAPAAPLVVAPADGSRTGDNTPTVTGTAEANSTVTVFIDGASVGTTTTDASGAWTLDAPLSLTDGAHTVYVTATDASGNVSASSNTNAFTVDTAAPVAPVVASPANGSLVSDNTPTFSGTAEANATVTVFIDGVAAGTTVADASGAWSFDAPVTLIDGMHTTSATATDAVGNVSVSSNTNSFTIDADAPSAPVVTAPAAGSTTGDDTPLITGTAEANAIVAVFVDGVQVGTVTANASGAWSFPSSTLADGAHTVRATATDAANNSSGSSSTSSFTVDTTAPSAPSVSAPAPQSSTTDVTPTITGTAEPLATIAVFIDGAQVGTATASATGDWSFDASMLSLGAHTVSARATDASGNSSVASATNDFTVLPFVPAAPSLTAPAQGSLTADTTPAFTGTAEPLSTVTVRVDGNVVCTTTATAAGDFSCTPSSPLTDGQRTATVSASNVGGTSPESAPTRFTIDGRAPLTPTLAGPANASTTTDTTPVITGTGEPGATVSITVDGQVIGTTTVAADGSWTFTSTTPLSVGSHVVSARSTDAAGNVSLPSNTNTFTVITATASTPVLSTPGDNAALSTARPTFTGTAAPGDSVTVLVDGAPVCVATANSSGAWACTAATSLTDGPHAAVAQTTGNTSNTSSFRVDTIAPSSPVVSRPVDGSSTSETRPEVSGTAEPLSTVAVFIDGLQAGTAAVDVDGRWSFTPTSPLTLSMHVVTATSTDRAGNTSAPSAASNFTITGPSNTPSVLTPAPGSSTNDATPLISGTSTPGATVEVLVDGAVVCTATATASGAWSCAPGTPLPEGPHAVTAREQGSNTTATPVSFIVDTVAPASPVIVTPAPNALTGVLPTLSGTAEPGARVEVKVDGAAVCVTLANAAGQWSCVPPAPLSMGAHQVTAIATDVAGNVSQPSAPVPFTVDRTPPPAPSVTGPANGSSSTDTTPRFEGSAEPGSTVTVSVDGMVVCVAVANSAGAYSCEATTSLPRGMHQVTATATDPAGNVSPSSPVSTFTVIAMTPPAPVITGPSSSVALSDATPTITGTAQPGSAIVVREGEVVICRAVADASGAWSCEASSLSEGVHSFTATSSDGGVESPRSAPHQVTIDTTPPVVQPEPENDTPNTTVTWPIEPNTTYECSVDGGAFVSCTNPLSLNGLPPGEHTVVVRGTDSAGNVTETSSTWLVKADYSLFFRGGGASCAAVPIEGLLPMVVWVLLRRRKRS
ncbi:MAG: Ig-like domain-containing protein [Archangium sp.]|nr:Ig-like domain-containing protein [Archangium sp.]MDP3570395.1 Ig-like domain-containing protein [Archangium sp.]